jgi:Protein required for attachment to host cells
VNHGRWIAPIEGMNRTLIAVVDASRARLFTCERIAPAEGLKEQIIERSDLVNPARRLHPSELFSDPHPGSNRTGGLQYGTDDHRDAHLDEIDAEFALTPRTV